MHRIKKIFQPTLPVRGATGVYVAGNLLIEFQPTLPVRGATERVDYPAGDRRISTHAPRAGSDP